MQYKGQGYMMLKDTTCKLLWKRILPFGIQTFLVLFMLEMISFGTQKRLTPLLVCLFTLMATTLSFFFFFKR